MQRINLYAPSDWEQMKKTIKHLLVDRDMNMNTWVFEAIREKLHRDKSHTAPDKKK